MCGAAVLTLRKPTPIKAFPYFHSFSLKTRCKIRESLFRSSLNSIRQKQKMLPHRFRWGIGYVLSFIIFLFCRRCSFSRSRRCIYLNFRMSSLYFSVRGCASLCGDAIKLTNSALAQYCIDSKITPYQPSENLLYEKKYYREKRL